MSAFDRYAPLIQDYIYSKGWSELRSVQEEAATAIFDSADHLLICSSTASGKTEAAFFPSFQSFSTTRPAVSGCCTAGRVVEKL